MIYVYKLYIDLINRIQNFSFDEQGVTAIEYGLAAVAMAGLIFVAFFSADSFPKKLQSKMANLSNKVENAKIVAPLKGKSTE